MTSCCGPPTTLTSMRPGVSRATRSSIRPEWGKTCAVIAIRGRRDPWIRQALFASVTSAALAVACSDGIGAGAPSGPGIHVASATLADSVFAVHALNLVVGDSAGKRARGVEVVLATPVVTDPNNPFAATYRVLIAPPDSSRFRPSLVDTTDDRGAVSVRVQFSYTAGQAELVVSVHDLGFVDTVHFAVEPGNPIGVRVAPADTALYAGRQLSLRPYAVDRLYNPRLDVPFEFRVASGPVTVNVAGAVTTTAIGRAAVVVEALGYSDTAYLSVVPEAWVATQEFYPGNGGPEGIFLMQLDGSGRDSLTSGLINSFTPHGFGWSPDGLQLILPRGTALHLLRPGGVEQPLVEMTAELNTAARFSRDGQWVYFALASASPTQRSGLYRIKPDGTSLEHIGDDTAHFGTDYFAAPSHDGLSVAYSSTRTPCFVDPCIRVLDLATNLDRVYGTQDYLVRGAMAAWSPVEDLIAYSSGSAVRLIRSDGTPRGVVAQDAGQVKWMEWSPDGHWLIVAADFGVVLFGVQNGLRLPLAQFLSYSATIWRPTQP